MCAHSALLLTLGESCSCLTTVAPLEGPTAAAVGELVLIRLRQDLVQNDLLAHVCVVEPVVVGPVMVGCSTWSRKRSF